MPIVSPTFETINALISTSPASTSLVVDLPLSVTALPNLSKRFEWNHSLSTVPDIFQLTIIFFFK
jgi:hypothetical protein